MRKIKVGVIGLGFIGKQHVEALRRLPYVEIVAGSDSNPAMRDWCEENGIGKYYADYKEMLKNEEMDAVHNCTPNNFHFAVSCEILEAGYHVYSEKPLTINSEEGNNLVELARKKGLKTAVNFNYRNNLMVQEMQQRIKNNRMGTISHIQVEYLQDWLLYDTDFDWRVQKDKGGESRAVADIGSHCFDTIQFIMGEKIVAVYALFHKQYQRRYMAKQADTFSSQKASGEHKGEAVPVENEDAAIILFKLEGGMVGSINITQVCAGKKNDLQILISGTNEAYEWHQETPAIYGLVTGIPAMKLYMRVKIICLRISEALLICRMDTRLDGRMHLKKDLKFSIKACCMKAKLYMRVRTLQQDYILLK